MDSQHDGPVKPVEVTRRSPEDILKNVIVKQAITITGLAAIAEQVPGLRAEIRRLTGELEKTLADIAALRESLPKPGGTDGDPDRVR